MSGAGSCRCEPRPSAWCGGGCTTVCFQASWRRLSIGPLDQAVFLQHACESRAPGLAHRARRSPAHDMRAAVLRSAAATRELSPRTARCARGRLLPSSAALHRGHWPRAERNGREGGLVRRQKGAEQCLPQSERVRRWSDGGLCLTQDWQGRQPVAI